MSNYRLKSAKKLLRHYIEMCFPKDYQFNYDNEQEVEAIVDDIVEGIKIEMAQKPKNKTFYGIEHCPCGHPSCKDYHLVGIGKFVQGSGFTHKEATLIINALYQYEGETSEIK